MPNRRKSLREILQINNVPPIKHLIRLQRIHNSQKQRRPRPIISSSTPEIVPFREAPNYVVPADDEGPHPLRVVVSSSDGQSGSEADDRRRPAVAEKDAPDDATTDAGAPYEEPRAARDRARDEFVAAGKKSVPLDTIRVESGRDRAVSQKQLVFDEAILLRSRDDHDDDDEDQYFEPHTLDSDGTHPIENEDSATFVTADDGGNDSQTASVTSWSTNNHPSEPSDPNSVSRSLHSLPPEELAVVEHFNTGDRVLVRDAHPTHKGKEGTVVGTTKCFVKVLFVGSSASAKPTLVAHKFLTVLLRSQSRSANDTASIPNTDHDDGIGDDNNNNNNNDDNNNGAPHRSIPSVWTESSDKTKLFNPGDQVQVVNTHQNHKNKCGVVLRTTNCFVFFADSSTNQEIRIRPKFLYRAPPAMEQSPSHSENGASNSAECLVVSRNCSADQRRLPNVSDGSSSKSQVMTKPTAVLGPPIPHFALNRLCYAPPPIAPKSAFQRMWKDKYLIREYDLPLGGKNSYSLPPLEPKMQFDGKNYELYYADVQNDPRRGMISGARIVKANKIAAHYVRTDDLRKHEESLADFASLKPRKVWARRKLFLSEAVKLPKNIIGLLPVSRADIAMVRDDGTVGCGFIGERYLETLLGGGAAAKRTIGIQVRIFVPSLGVFKGVLVRKLRSAGPPIELNASLRKVLPSTLEGAADVGYIVIKRTFPSETNLQIGRLFRRDRPVTQSFKKSVMSREKCKLSDMYVRLLNGLGVPKEMTEEYSKLFRNLTHLRHTHLVGVADPTGWLPPNSVFMTGVKRGDVDVEKIFVTRPPCLEPEDGRLLEWITARPRGMPQKDWDWLNGLYFGALVFANPMEGQRPLPELIADGDLDGDLYFVCWDKKILSNIKHVPIEHADLCASNAEATLSYDADWFDKTQQFISDVSNIVSVHDFVGFLFNQNKNIAEEKSIRDSDAVAFAKAYKQALEFKKHGEKICIPAHLLTCVPEHFHKFCHSV